MIIKRISAENFGKFDRYSVNLDDNINVFYGDNEAGKTTLYEIISILLFAPLNDEEMAESNKLIKTDEKYARVYAIINMDGREISIAREIYVNDTNLSIADQDNVSSLGNVNVPFIGDLTKEMYESFHTIDYYNMATITNNVWQQIINIIEDSHGAPRITPDFSSPEDENDIVKQKSEFEVKIEQKEKEKAELEMKLKEAQKNQKRMIRNQDKIDDLISELEDVENNIELETSYLNEANKMNQIRTTIKRTQDLTLEFEKYKNLKPWMPNLRKYYERLKLYSDNKLNGIENPLDMFDDLEDSIENNKADEKQEEKVDKVDDKDIKQEVAQPAKEEKAAEEVEQVIPQEDIKADTKEELVVEEIPVVEEVPVVEQKAEVAQETQTLELDGHVSEDEVEKEFDYSKIKLPSEEDYDLAREKINKFIEESYLNYEPKVNSDAEDSYLDNEEDIDPANLIEEVLLSDESDLDLSLDLLEDNEYDDDDENEEELPEELPIDIKPLEIRKPKDMKTEDENLEVRGAMNSYGQTNPYSDNIYPDMDKVNYSSKDLSKIEVSDDDEDRYSLSTSYDLPTQTKRVSEKEMSNNKNNNDDSQEMDKLLKAEEFLNNVNMQEIIAASKEEVDVDDEAKEEIDRAQLRYKIIAKRVFGKDMDMDELSKKLNNLDTNAIYKSVVKYKGLAQKQRKLEQSATKVEQKPTTSGMSIVLAIIAVFSMLLGLACFFIDQIIAFLPNIGALAFVAETIKGLPLSNIVPGNFIAGGAFVLISILLTIAIILGNDTGNTGSDYSEVNEVELDELKNNIRMAKRQVIDALKDFPIPSSYLENPNNTIITVINELREAEVTYNSLVSESMMPKNESYRLLWKLSRQHLGKDELSDDLFDNISKLRRKIQDYKEEKSEKERKLKEAKMRINMVAGSPSFSNDNKKDDTFPQMNDFANTSQPNQKANNVATSPYFGLPQAQSNDFGMSNTNDQAIKNASESSSFSLPQTSSNTLGEVGMPAQSQNISLGMPQSQPTDLGIKMETNQSTDTNSFGAKMDTSYPTDNNEFGTVKDTSYPTDNNSFGTKMDASYPTDNNEFGTVKDTSYPIDSNSFGTKMDASFPTGNSGFGDIESSNQTGQSNDFGIPGINRYSGTEQSNQTESAQNNPYDIKGVNRYSDDIQSQQPESTNDNPYDIPGIKRYSNDTVEKAQSTSNSMFSTPEGKVEAQNASENPFDIPGVNRYSSNTQEQEASAGNNQFGLPGVNRYTNDTQENTQSENNNLFGAPEVNKPEEIKPEQNISSNDNPFDIPGIKRYTNDTQVQQNVSAQENASSIPAVNNNVSAMPPSAQENTEANMFGSAVNNGYSSNIPVQDTNTSVNNGFSSNEQQPIEQKPSGFPSGLPGLDKFSNRGEQASKEVIQSNVTPDVPVVTPVSTPVEAVGVAAAGALVSGGLPGLDKFSNRGEQLKDTNVVEDKAELQTEQDSMFGIPGIHRYSGMEQQENNQPVETVDTQTTEDVDPIAIEVNELAVTADVKENNKVDKEQTDVVEANEQVDKKPIESVEAIEQVEEEPAEKVEQIEQVDTIKIVEEPVQEEIEQVEPEEVQEEIVRVKDRREQEYDRLLELLGDDPESSIRDVEDVARQLHKEIIRRDKAMASLLKLNDAAVRLSTLSSNKWPYKQKAVEASQERIDYLEADKLKLTRHLQMLDSKIEEVEYEETPQAIADRLKAVNEEIEQLKLESDKHAIAAELIEKQKLLDMSSSADRSHVIDDTSIYMKELTLGKYTKVKINDNQSGLSICDKDGQWFDTTKDRLSQATREQLYLALRISIADLFDEKSLIFPMFFDEALITWDKRRMKAVMRLLSKMSMHRQVIIFTCHDWLKDMISEYLIGAKIILM